MVDFDGTRSWYKQGILKRKIYPDNTKQIYNRFGKLVKTYHSNGLIETVKDDELHSYNDEPAITMPDGTRLWYQNGKLHRELEKPAVVSQNEVSFYFDGKLIEGRYFIGSDLILVRSEDGSYESYHKGLPHSYMDKPAIYNAATGLSEWYNMGLLVKQEVIINQEPTDPSSFGIVPFEHEDQL